MVPEENSGRDASAPHETASSSELVKIEIGKESEALTASVLEQMERMSARQAATDQALIAALQQIGGRDPVVNVQAPNVDVKPPEVTVEAPSVTVEAPNVTVEAPNVNVEIPAERRSVTFERDRSGRISGAVIEDE